MSNITLEVVFILILIIINGLFAMCEMAIVSARRVRLQQQANKGNKNARVALDLANEPNSFLSTVQIGITLIGILAGAFGGVTIAENLKMYLSSIPSLISYAETISIAVVVISITYLSLVIGELVPKRLALNHAEDIALFVARPMRFLAKLVSPLVYILSNSTNLFLKLLGIREIREEIVTQEEIALMIHQGTQTGVFEPVEKEMVEGVFRLGDRSVTSVMTLKNNIVWIDVNDSIEEIKKKIHKSTHSCFPIAYRTISKVVGIVYAKELLDVMLSGLPLDLKAFEHNPLFVPENISILKTLESFKESKKDMAIVVDEYGEVQGLVTLHDILEAIVGDIPYRGELQDKPIVQREDGSWLLDGLLHIDKVKELLDVEKMPEEEKRKFQTLGGFIMTYFGNIPSTGDNFKWDKWKFEVVDMDGHKVDKILISRLENSSPIQEHKD